jgi:hypothetical protein
MARVRMLQTGGDFCDGGHITSLTCPSRGGAERGLRRPSKRVTKAALAAAKARGVRLGVHGPDILAPKYRAEAKARAEQLAPVIRELQRDGYSFNGNRAMVLAAAAGGVGRVKSHGTERHASCFSLCGCARPTFNPLGSPPVRYLDVADISVPPA